MTRGQYDYRVSDIVVADLKWKDKTSVFFVTNYLDPTKAGVVTCKERNGDRTGVTYPDVVMQYKLYKLCWQIRKIEKYYCYLQKVSQKSFADHIIDTGIHTPISVVPQRMTPINKECWILDKLLQDGSTRHVSIFVL